ncbi:putative alanine and proline rich membrane protein [Mycobacterium xenopi 4042]|nr:putative alanine and proline rich membrane protein [Mycobacterium xenopi 4042]
MEPAAPPDLVAAVRSLANRSEELGMVFLADKPDSIQNPLRQDLDADVATIDRLCK